MLSKEEFIEVSLEVNLFFQRIMKEHLFFIETNLQPAAAALKREASLLKKGFEELLAQTVRYSDLSVTKSAISSNEFVTSYTLKAEEITAALTGASINLNITKAELGLSGAKSDINNYDKLYRIVRSLNTKSSELLNRVIQFQIKLISMLSKCNIFITLYHEILKHNTREAEYYMEILTALQNGLLPERPFCDRLNFWNNIMGEHAEFIDGMLDPTEKTLKETASDFAGMFETLVKKCVRSAEHQMINESRGVTEGIKDYKAASTAGLINCKIKSIIPPLLADHVLREANHYLRMLR